MDAIIVNGDLVNDCLTLARRILVRYEWRCALRENCIVRKETGARSVFFLV